jgi:uncharacterized membrane protein HdeD (DUF308 family)
MSPNESPTPFAHAEYAEVTAEVREHRNWFLGLGVLLVALGIAAIIFPVAATLAIEVVIGWILVISGVAGIVQAYRAARWKGYLFTLLGALLSLAIGALLLLYPLTGALSLTLVIAAFFFAGGVVRVLLALKVRPLDHWGWTLASGILALAIAVLILVQWPEAAAWVIGLLVGVDLLFGGWTSILLALAARRSA